MSPGELIAHRRHIYNLSQKDLADLAQTSQGQISRIERGDISPTVSTLEQLLAAMGERLILRSKPMRGQGDNVLYGRPFLIRKIK